MSNEARFATQLEHLPAEVWLKIFAFIPLPQLVPSFLGLNAHIDAIVRSVRRQRHVVRCNDADAVHFLRLFPATISHLMIVNSDMADLTPCTNLRSLTLKWGTIAQLDSIRPCHLPLLEVLHIKALHPDSIDSTNAIQNLFTVILCDGFPRLQTCTALDVGVVIFNDQWTGSSSFRTMNLKTQGDDNERKLRSKLPNIERLTTYEDSWITPTTRKSALLKQLELNNRFIVDVHPFEHSFDRNKLPARFNGTRAFQRPPGERLTIIQGRILPQTEPYCRASFLLEIVLMPEYPFKPPEFTLLDPVYHPQVTDLGRCCDCTFTHRCHNNFAGERNYRPPTPLSDIINNIIDVIDNPVVNVPCHNPKRATEYFEDYPTFARKALEMTLSFGRPRH